MRAWPEGAEINKRLILWCELRCLGVVVVEATEILSLRLTLRKNDGKEQMTVITLIGSSLNHVVVSILEIIPTMTEILAIDEGSA